MRFFRILTALLILSLAACAAEVGPVASGDGSSFKGEVVSEEGAISAACWATMDALAWNNPHDGFEPETLPEEPTVFCRSEPAGAEIAVQHDSQDCDPRVVMMTGTEGIEVRFDHFLCGEDGERPTRFELTLMVNGSAVADLSIPDLETYTADAPGELFHSP